MDAKTAKALEASINHWEENLIAEESYQASATGRDCALCQIFVLARPSKDCDDCPVAQATGAPMCEGSPFDAAYTALYNWSAGRGTRDAFRLAARAELDFLTSLLPENPDAH